MTEVENEPNCIAYAYWRAGIQDKDQYVEPPLLNELDPRLTVVTPKHAVIIGIASPLEPALLTEPDILVYHMAYIDPENPTLVWERRGIGLKVSEQPIRLDDFLKREIIFDVVFPVYLGIRDDLK
jgi:hypothetical protein